MLIEICICGKINSFQQTENKNGLEVALCSNCGVLIQQINSNKEKVLDYYKKHYHKKIHKHTYAEDYEAAEKRIEAYKIKYNSKILDVGCSNGAFIDACKEHGYKAIGQDICNPDKRNDVYEKELNDIYFPTDEFDGVALHDVFEHLIDPEKELKEVFRILKPQGRLFLDIPDFFSEDGKKHWKEFQHIWLLKTEQMEVFLKKIGFVIDSVYHPIPGKTTFIAHKPDQNNRKSILVPPGMGDIYWSLVKMQSLISSLDINIPDVYICSTTPDKDRSYHYLKMYPFLNAAGYVRINERSPVWKEAYFDNGRTLFENVEGCDYFLAYNGILRHGRNLDDCDAHWPVNWNLPRFESLEEIEYGITFKKHIGKYIIAYFPSGGMYQKWLKQFPIDKICYVLQKVCAKYRCKVVLPGAKWDEDDPIYKSIAISLKEKCIDISGETSVEQLFGVLKNSIGVVGYPSGLTIMAADLDIPTLCLWNEYFRQEFWWDCVKPESRHKNYEVLNTKDLDKDLTLKTFKELVK